MLGSEEHHGQLRRGGRPTSRRAPCSRTDPAAEGTVPSSRRASPFVTGHRGQGAAGRRCPTSRPGPGRGGGGARRRPASRSRHHDAASSDTVPGGHGRSAPSPPAGTLLPRGQRGARCSSRAGPALVDVPNVVGQTAGRSGEHRSPDAGLSVRVSFRNVTAARRRASSSTQTPRRRAGSAALSIVTHHGGHLTLDCLVPRARSSRPAVARDARPLGGARVGGDAPPDAGAARRRRVRRVPRAVPHADGDGRRRAGRGDRRVGTARLPAPGAAAVGGVASSIAPTGWPDDLTDAARRRALHRGARSPRRPTTPTCPRSR